MNIDAALDEFEQDLAKLAEEESKFPLGLSEHAFKVAFVPQFLAAVAANRFSDYCARGMQEKISDLPFEDAEFLAEEAYKKYYEFKN
jgi:hypothetical protein